VLALLVAGAGSASASPLSSTALWVNQAASPEAMIAAAAQAHVRTLFVKGAEGTTVQPQLTPALVAALRAAGIDVCAWTFDRGADPAGEATAAIVAVHAGASCLVVDAEGEYDSRYGAAQQFVRALRSGLGARFPIALAGQAEILRHQKFPYSVFLGPGGFNFTMPQLYWRELSSSVARLSGAVFGENAIYGRPVLPVGQLFDGVTADEVAGFQCTVFEHGASAASFFDLDAAGPELLAAIAPRPCPLLRFRTQQPTIRPGADGDEVLWAQELLNAAGARLPVGGFFGAQTGRALTRFQARRHLRRSGLLDAPTWRALLHLKAREPSWAKGPPLSAR
jgi:hypothetical protein